MSQKVGLLENSYRKRALPWIYGCVLNYKYILYLIGQTSMPRARKPITVYQMGKGWHTHREHRTAPK